MLRKRRLARDLSAALLACTTFGAAPTAQEPTPGTATFVVMLRGARIGFETVTLARTPAGWTITSGGRLQAPFDLLTTRFELNYAPDWQPRNLAIEGVLQGQLVNMTTAFDGTAATTTLIKGEATATNAVQVSPRTVVLPANFFGAYEALAAQIGAMSPGTVFRAYLAPEFEVAATLDKVTPRRVALPGAAVDIHEYALTLTTPLGPTAVQIWTDSRRRLVRVMLPRVGLLAVREDLATVLAREEHVRNPGDDTLFIPATGFSLGATVTSPQGAPGLSRRAAVVLVSGPGPQDRDFSVLGASGHLPVFGQLAGALADRGYVVVRYDPRGIGQSGGRTENAALEEYAADVLHVVNWLRRRPNVDGNRLGIIGYGEGAAVALLAARREDRIRAVALVAAPAVGGHALTLEQQESLLDRLHVPLEERAAKIALQKRVLDATESGEGWDKIPFELRRQADSVTFRSWLRFDPGPVIQRLEQPLLILHGALDEEINPTHADRLETLAQARRNVPPAHSRKVVLPGVTHQLAHTESGEAGARVAAEPVDALATWLGEVLPPR